MGDVVIPKPPTSKVGAKVEDLIEAGHELYASAVTGTPQGRVRRPTLFAIACAAMALGPLTAPGVIAFIFTVVGLIAILLLAMSDAVVEL